jgi:hypothetical protein
MTKKICSTCSIEKDICDFHKGNDKDGYQNIILIMRIRKSLEITNILRIEKKQI